MGVSRNSPGVRAKHAIRHRKEQIRQFGQRIMQVVDASTEEQTFDKMPLIAKWRKNDSEVDVVMNVLILFKQLPRKRVEVFVNFPDRLINVRIADIRPWEHTVCHV